MCRPSGKGIVTRNESDVTSVGLGSPTRWPDFALSTTQLRCARVLNRGRRTSYLKRGAVGQIFLMAALHEKDA